MAEPITAAQAADMLAEAERHQREFDEWAADVLAGKAKLEGVERDAMRAGFWAGRQRADTDARNAQTADYTARQRVAYSVGYGEGRALPQVDHPDAVQPPSAAELIRQLRERRNP